MRGLCNLNKMQWVYSFQINEKLKQSTVCSHWLMRSSLKYFFWGFYLDYNLIILLYRTISPDSYQPNFSPTLSIYSLKVLFNLPLWRAPNFFFFFMGTKLWRILRHGIVIQKFFEICLLFVVKYQGEAGM